MRTIVSPTDFSACAKYASDAAAELARRQGATLHLITCLDLPNGWDDMSQEQQALQPRALEKSQAAQQKLQELAYSYTGLTVETRVMPLPVRTSLNAYAQSQSADLIVMGSHGASGKQEFFIGSNTQKVVREVHVPVLVVKAPLPDLNFDKVVFASSFHENEREAFLRFKELVKPFVPEIHLVEIHTSSLFDPPYILSHQALEDFRGLCAPFRCKTHILRNYSVDQGVRVFADEIGAKLIGISNHHRHPMKRMLAGSNVEALVNHADVPVLSIDLPVVPNETPVPG